MRNQLATAPGRYGHPPQPVSVPAWRPTRRVGLLDRVALHVGVALIKWGRPPLRREQPGISRESVEALRSLEERRNTYQLWGSELTRLR
jgi:hypothetical protein